LARIVLEGEIVETVKPLYNNNSNTVNARDATGVFFYDQTEESLNKAIEDFENNEDLFHRDMIQQNTLRFSINRYKEQIRSYVEERLYEDKK